MPSNFTSNYNLNQWEPDDRVLRTDFNADNTKIDAALSELKQKADMSLYYIGQIGSLINFHHKTPPRLPQQGFIWDVFDITEDGPTLTGSAVMDGRVLTVSGAGNTGTWEVNQLLSVKKGWTNGKLWIRASGGTVVPTIGDAVITDSTAYGGWWLDGDKERSAPVYCFDFASASGQPVRGFSVKLHLDLTAGNPGPLRVYNFSAVFL